MRKSVYYFTMSLDGYIADKNGSIDWMSGAPNVDYGFKEFYDEVGTVMLGARTYEHMLKMGDFFPYPDRDVIVCSSNDKLKIAAENVQLSSEDPAKTLARLQLGTEDEGHIWVGGGGTLAGTLFEAGLIDELRVFVQPVILGDGTKALVSSKAFARALEFQSSKDWPMGIIELRYNVPKRWRSDI
ncbi:MAG: dihydrofolate reductase family protein [Coriobacteriia bacterium]|nr:dihydrofolate reductase family protein [Coriobacteriia bacterium]MCL2870091.1 dihydrofolate reductase family protein [Coriobacteriia bacterium]